MSHENNEHVARKKTATTTYLHNKFFGERFEWYATPPSIIPMPVVAHTPALLAHTAATFNAEASVVCQNQTDRRKIWYAEASRSVPAASSWETTDTTTRGFGRASILTFSNVNESPQVVRTESVSRKAIEQWVEEAKWWLSPLEPHVVEQRYECTESGRCGPRCGITLKQRARASSYREGRQATRETRHCNVRERAATLVKHGSGQRRVRRQIVAHLRLLVRSAPVTRRKTTAAAYANTKGRITDHGSEAPS